VSGGSEQNNDRRCASGKSKRVHTTCESREPGLLDPKDGREASRGEDHGGKSFSRRLRRPDTDEAGYSAEYSAEQNGGTGFDRLQVGSSGPHNKETTRGPLPCETLPWDPMQMTCDESNQRAGLGGGPRTLIGNS
jgi:hypothetical protein